MKVQGLIDWLKPSQGQECTSRFMYVLVSCSPTWYNHVSSIQLHICNCCWPARLTQRFCQGRPGQALGLAFYLLQELGQHPLTEAYLVEMMISIVDKREELSSSTDLRIQSWLGKAELCLKLHAHAEKTRENPGYSHSYPYQRLHKYTQKTSKWLIAQLCLTLGDPMDWSHEAPLSMGYSRQECQSGLSVPPLGDLPNPGIESHLLCYRWISYHLGHQRSSKDLKGLR